MIFRFTLSHEIEGTLILQKDPQGWKDLEAILKRGIEYHGTFYETMVQLEFACGSGKEFIDKIYDTYGVDAVINILIEISCTGSGGTDISEDYSDDYSDEYGSKIDLPGTILFETFYEGVLDLSKYNKFSRSTFSDILQSDFIQKVINRFETTVELTQNQSLDGVELAPISGFPSDITLHGKAILLQNKFFVDTFGETTVPNPISSTLYIPMQGISEISEIPYTYDAEPPYIRYYRNSGDFNTLSLQWFYRNLNDVQKTFDISLRLKFEVDFAIPYNDSSVDVTLVLLTNNILFDPASLTGSQTTLQTINVTDVIGGVTNTVEFDVTYNGTFNVDINKSCFLYLVFPNIGNDAVTPLDFVYEVRSEIYEFNLFTTDVFRNTTASFFKIHEAGAAISQRITSLEDCFRSDLLGRKNSEPTQYDENGCFSFAGILNGKHIRGIESPLFCSMKDFYQSINSYYPCGIGFQKESGQYILRLAERDYFYDNSQVILQCQFAKEIKYSVAKEYYTGDLFIGFREWEVENINGLNEVNSKRQYVTGVKAINNKVDLESVFVGGMYALELTRRKIDSSVDSPYDDKNFIICTSRNTDSNGIPNNMGIAEKDENFTTVNGILNPATAYNLRITPVRNLLRHLRYIASSIYKSVGSVVRFTYGEGNFNAESQINDNLCTLGNYGNELLSEKQDIAWDNTIEPSTPVYIPEYIEFEYPVSFANYLIIKNNPYKCIEVSEGNSNFIKGFIIEVRWKPVGGIAYFKLLRAWQ